MSLIKGPFTIKWGDNQIEDIEEIAIEHSVDSEDFKTVQGKTIEVDGAYKVTAVITLLASDIPALAAILPQYYVANGETMSTGETVNNANGAIDVKAASCDESIVFNNLDIIACGVTPNVLRLVNCRTKIESISVDDKLQKVAVKFVGESESGEATVQMFIEDSLSEVS